jgi:hypothetical protein
MAGAATLNLAVPGAVTLAIKTEIAVRSLIMTVAVPVTLAPRLGILVL